jgi:hypothetical protein
LAVGGDGEEARYAVPIKYNAVGAAINKNSVGDVYVLTRSRQTDSGVGQEISNGEGVLTKGLQERGVIGNHRRLRRHMAAVQGQENRHQHPSPPLLNRAFQEHFHAAKLNTRQSLMIKQLLRQKFRAFRASAAG